MQRCQFSETQFSFCFTFEYVKRFHPFIPLPIFPNTVNEGRAGGGYDVAINGNIYFQFKIPTYHDLVSNFWRRDYNVFQHDYYKIKVETNSQQFRLLKELQNANNHAYYSAPSFHSQDDLRNFYNGDIIVDKSALFSISNLPDHGSGYHYIIYSPHHDWGRIFSEPIDIKVSKLSLDFFPVSQNTLTIYRQAVHIANILRERQFGNFDFGLNVPREMFVKHVYSTLLTSFNIHWYPIFPQR